MRQFDTVNAFLSSLVIGRPMLVPFFLHSFLLSSPSLDPRVLPLFVFFGCEGL